MFTGRRVCDVTGSPAAASRGVIQPIRGVLSALFIMIMCVFLCFLSLSQPRRAEGWSARRRGPEEPTGEPRGPRAGS